MSKIRVYTDGACRGNPGPGGWGAIILLKDGKKEISGFEEYTTNNRMELMAVIKALKCCIKKYNCNSIDVYSDSAYVVNAIKQEWLRRWKWNGFRTRAGEPVKNQDLWISLDELLKGRKINLIKIKGHNGHKHNERVDLIAKAAIDNSPLVNKSISK